ncbi:MAG: hypothetical protein HC869_05505 [Rhodospirillales bacterium]|nr:hypothetical protein [Rhodospirillales bacterium]
MAEVKESSGRDQQRTVPYGALAEERARRKELQRELQNAIESQQRLRGRLDLLHNLAQKQGAVEAGPDVETMPERGDERPHDDTPAEVSVSEAQAQFRTQLMHSVRDVMRERPDFLAAYQHAREARVSELCALGYAPQEALAITFDNEAEIIGNAFAAGHNPAQVIFDYAQRHGYRGGPGPVQHGARMAPGSAPAMSEAEKVALAARGQAASKSLSNAGGGSAGTLTLEALAGMSDEEFAEVTKGDRWQKLLR